METRAKPLGHRRRVARYFAAREGLPPATFIPKLSAANAESIRCVEYSAEEWKAEQIPMGEAGIAEVLRRLHVARTGPGVAWFHINGNLPHNLGLLLAEGLQLDHLILENIESDTQRPKIEYRDAYTYITCRATLLQDDEFLEDQANFVFGDGFLFSFSNGFGLGARSTESTVRALPDWSLPLYDRIIAGRGQVRKRGSDYLCYTLIDLIVDRYFTVMDAWESRTEAIENDVLFRGDPGDVAVLKQQKDLINQFRRAAMPLQELFLNLLQEENEELFPDSRKYFRDAYDHLLVLLDMIESMKDSLSDLMTLQASVASNRLNQIMKILTLLSAIFIPVTFISGIFGMNFVHIPGLDSGWGFGVVLGSMVLVIFGMLVYFKRKGWY